MLAKRYPEAVFRSGNAEGTDTVFAGAVISIDPKRIEYVLPSPRMGHDRIYPESKSLSLEELPKVAEELLSKDTIDATPGSERLVFSYLGLIKNGRLAAKAKYLLRDTLKVRGAPELNLAPAAAGIFYVNSANQPADFFDKSLKGGTWHTIRVCARQNVPVATQHTWRKWIQT